MLVSVTAMLAIVTLNAFAKLLHASFLTTEQIQRQLCHWSYYSKQVKNLHVLQASLCRVAAGRLMGSSSRGIS